MNLNVTAIDAGGLSKTQGFAIAVNDVVENTAPTDLALSATTVNENVPTGTIVGNFSTTDAEGGSFTYAFVTGTGSGDNGAFTISNGNQLQINSSPNFEAKSSYSIRVKTTDADGLSFEKAIAIGVNNVNEAPTAVKDSISAYKNTTTTIAASTLLANDTDPDAGTILKITGVSNATNGSVSLNSSGNVVFTPTKIGDASFQYTVSDGSLTSTATVAVSVGLKLNGGNGIDVLLGSDYNDLLNGNDGADALYGNKGNDILNGGKGNDLLLGGQGNDILNGGDNADALYGGKGNDTLNGGGGADTFFFAVGDGSDTIEDFSDRTDKIGLTGGLRFGQLTISSSGSNTLISYGTETLATLTGINSSLITSADFVTI
ncbi:calcium-binding protein [Nostoc sp.]|uniref:calcium-binding protein n=1 Tax=Nostoc sp. TaxID=1180 RepID=UPI002FF65247